VKADILNILKWNPWVITSQASFSWSWFQLQVELNFFAFLHYFLEYSLRETPFNENMEHRHQRCLKSSLDSLQWDSESSSAWLIQWNYNNSSACSKTLEAVAVMWTCVPKYFCQKLRILCGELFDPLHMTELQMKWNYRWWLWCSELSAHTHW